MRKLIISQGIMLPTKEEMKCPNCGHQCDTYTKEFKLNKYSQCSFERTDKVVAQVSCPKCFCVWQIVPE